MLLKEKIAGCLGAILLTLSVAVSGLPLTASAATVTPVVLGSSQTSFEVGVYTVPVSLKNATSLDKDSGAAGCLAPYGTLTIGDDGTARLQADLKAVEMMGITDYAYDFKVYQGNGTNSALSDMEVVETKNATLADGSEKDVPTKVQFEIPDAVKEIDGTYINMYVTAMNAAPNAFLKIDYANAVKAGAPTVKSGSSSVDQFGKYDVTADVTVVDGKISNLEVSGSNFNTSFESYNQMYLTQAAEGMKTKIIGLYDTDAKGISSVDAVTNATTSSKAVKAAVMDALNLEMEEEVIPEVPTSVPAAGTYTIEMKNITDAVDHSLVETEKTTATSFERKK